MKWFFEKIEYLITSGNLEEALKEVERIDLPLEPSEERALAALKAALRTATVSSLQREWLIEIALNSLRRIK